MPVTLPLRTFSSTRNVYEKGGRMIKRDVTVMAPNGPEAARIISDSVAENFKKYGPKLPSLLAGPKGNKKDDDE